MVIGERYTNARKTLVEVIDYTDRSHVTCSDKSPRVTYKILEVGDTNHFATLNVNDTWEVNVNAFNAVFTCKITTNNQPQREVL